MITALAARETAAASALADVYGYLRAERLKRECPENEVALTGDESVRAQEKRADVAPSVRAL